MSNMGMVAPERALPGKTLSEKRHLRTTSTSKEPTSGPFVVLCEPRLPHAGRLLSGLAEILPVVQETSLENLAQYGRRPRCVALILPLEWPESAAAVDTSADTVLRFIRAHRHEFAITVYADTTRMPIGVYCGVLCAGARRVFNEASPTFAEDLCRHLRQLVENDRAQREEEEKLASLFENCGLIGQSSALREVFRRGVRASRFSDLPVLIGGETGTGKQRLAEAIHRLDPKRGQKPFLTINCSAISKNLAESELFGHVRGAFSGADSEREGLFRAANGGSLFLDEVGELDLDLQPKLLRVLQEQRVLPVGGDHEHVVNLRVIAATNRRLEDMVAAGTFREDLYHRLNLFQIRIPPLRERPEDIESQARHFLNIHHVRQGQPALDLADCVLEALRSLPWEGNTRQLENLIREILTFKERGNLIDLEDLPAWALAKLADSSPPAPANLAGHGTAAVSLPAALADCERALLRSVLRKNDGNRTRTALDLGLTPRTLYNKIKKYGLDPSSC
jgi:transcriptional regulator with PAS, ATPase and Fis domain